MRPAFRMIGFVLLVCLIGVGRAEAGIWDWVEELNGPGPSSSGKFLPLTANLLCTKATGRQKPAGDAFGIKVLNRALQLPDQDDKGTCLFVEYHAWHAPDDDPRFYPTDLSLWEIGTSTRLHPTIEIGAAMGNFSFSGINTDDPNAQEISGSRVALTFPRMIFKPLRAFPFSFFQREGFGFLQLYFKHTILLGELTDKDFASKPNTEPFSRQNQRVESVGVMLDVSALLNLLTHE